jgi:CRP-like cAMP-binding protein
MRRSGLDPPFACQRCPLRPLPAFKRLQDGELAFIARRKIGQKHVEAGGVIVPEGEAAEHVYTLLSGWAFRFKTLADGRRQIMSFLLPGDILGLQAELLDAAAHGVEAVTDVSLCAFARDTVWSVYRVHPSLAFDLTWLAAHGERLVDDAMLSVGRRTAMESVAALFVNLFKRAESAGLRLGDSVPFPLTQTHVADALGLSAVHTNRTIQRLRRMGLVQIAEGRLSIGDLRSLRRVAQYWEQPSPLRPLF